MGGWGDGQSRARARQTQSNNREGGASNADQNGAATAGGRQEGSDVYAVDSNQSGTALYYDPAVSERWEELFLLWNLWLWQALVLKKIGL